MTALSVQAPGKMFVLGEYAVLHGAPAVVAAIDRGVRCRVTSGTGVEAPGDGRFVRAALAAVAAPPRRYVFEDVRPPPLGGAKPGFGGSAAATVAACLAGLVAGGREIDGLEATAVAVHRAVQGGGSGLDVRASVRGHLRRYEGDRAPRLPDLPLLAVWSGRPAATAPRVRAFLAWRGGEGFARRSAELVAAFTADPLAAIREAAELLGAMAREAGIAWDTPAHARIRELARAHGGAAKPSGAGGGDVAVALVPDPEDRAAFAAACHREDLRPIPVELAPGAGVLGEEHPHRRQA